MATLIDVLVIPIALSFIVLCSLAGYHHDLLQSTAWRWLVPRQLKDRRREHTREVLLNASSRLDDLECRIDGQGYRPHNPRLYDFARSLQTEALQHFQHERFRTARDLSKKASFVLDQLSRLEEANHYSDAG